MLGNIRVSQMVSLIIFIASVVLLIIMGFRVKRDPESFVLYVNTEQSRLLMEKETENSDENAHILGDDEISENADDNFKEENTNGTDY